MQFTADTAVERACRLSGALLLDREVYIDSAANGSRPIAPEPGKPVEGCWFCLSNPTADTDLVVSIGKTCCLVQQTLHTRPQAHHIRLQAFVISAWSDLSLGGQTSDLTACIELFVSTAAACSLVQQTAQKPWV